MTRVWDAARNLVRTVVRDPVWAILSVVRSLLLRHFGDHADDPHGPARFASRAQTDRRAAASASGLLIGRDLRSGRLLRHDGPTHLLTLAPARTGKDGGTVLPNLLMLDRSIVCIDPQGEYVRIAGRARDRFGPVHVLDPFGVTGRRSAVFDPLDGLATNSPDLAEGTAALAEALVVDAPGEDGATRWNEEAKALIGGLLLFIATEEPAPRRHLATLRELLTMAPPSFAALLRRMQASARAGGRIAQAAQRQLGKTDREAAGVLSAAQRHTHFLDSLRMAAVLDHSEFSFADLKAATATVFLVLPPDRLVPYARWLRLLVTRALQDLVRARPGSGHVPVPVAAPWRRRASRPPPPVRPPVLLLLDQFAALGPLAPVERAVGLLDAHGVQLWPILQDLHQLHDTYGLRADSFLSHAGVLQVLGVHNPDSARALSDLLRDHPAVVFETHSRSLDASASGLTYDEQPVGRSLLTPDDVRQLPEHLQLLFLAGRRPVVARQLRHHEDREFAGLFEPVRRAGY